MAGDDASPIVDKLHGHRQNPIRKFVHPQAQSNQRKKIPAIVPTNRGKQQEETNPILPI
jgi:hypothetical protein